MCVPVSSLAAPAEALSSTAEQAVRICDRVDDRPGSEARDELERGLTLGEAAVAASDQDAKAHFAVFCNLAKLTYLDGFSMRSLFAVWRLRREIDRAIELQPDYTDALIAKAGLLLNLPVWLGGDAGEAERLLRRAVEIEPDRILPRLYLAEALLALGARAQAAEQAHYALALAQRADRPAQAAAARTLIARLEK